MATQSGEKVMATVMEIVQHISQAISEKQQGGKTFGLKREEPKALFTLHDRNVMDGFNIQFCGNQIVLKYHAEHPITDIHKKNFDVDVERTLAEIVKHLKENYKAYAKEALQLKESGETKILVQTANRRTAYVNAMKTFEVGNYGDSVVSVCVPQTEQENKLNSAMKKWLELGKKGK
jgi:hypothetical protein